MTDAARDLAPMANPDGRDANVWSEYEIETQTSLVDRALRTLKHGDAFAVLDSSGDIGTIADTAEGLFYRDTRYLSHYELRIEGKRPLLLSAGNGPALVVDGTVVTESVAIVYYLDLVSRGEGSPLAVPP